MKPKTRKANERVMQYWGTARWNDRVRAWDRSYLQLWEGQKPLIAKSMGAVIVGPCDTGNDVARELSQMLENYCWQCGGLLQVYCGTTDHWPQGLCDGCLEVYHAAEESKA